MAPLAGLQLTEMVVSGLISGVDLQRAPVQLAGPFGVGSAGQPASQCVMGDGVLRIESDRFSQVKLGLGVFLASQDETQIEPGRKVRGVLFHRAPVFGDGDVGPPLGQSHTAADEPLTHA